VRFFLGLGESGSFPAGLKAVADWFPKRERALAIGVFNAGANIGAILTPILVPAITLEPVTPQPVHPPRAAALALRAPRVRAPRVRAPRQVRAPRVPRVQAAPQVRAARLRARREPGV